MGPSLARPCQSLLPNTSTVAVHSPPAVTERAGAERYFSFLAWRMERACHNVQTKKRYCSGRARQGSRDAGPAHSMPAWLPISSLATSNICCRHPIRPRPACQTGIMAGATGQSAAVNVSEHPASGFSCVISTFGYGDESLY